MTAADELCPMCFRPKSEANENCTHERIPPNFLRANGDCICDGCSKPYRKHPLATEPECLGFDGPFLHRLCDGTLVKL